MTKRRNTFVALIMAGLTVWAAQMARADILFSDSFETAATSLNPPLPAKWVGVSNVNTTRVYAVSGVASDGTQSLFFQNDSGSLRVIRMASPVDVTGLSSVILSLDLGQTTTQYEGADYALFRVSFNGGSPIDMLKDAGAYNGAGTPTAPVEFSGSLITLDGSDANGAGTSNFKSYYVQINLPVGTTSLNFYLASIGSSSSENTWLDNVVIASVPEPATLALLGLGGLVLLSRRQQA